MSRFTVSCAVLSAFGLLCRVCVGAVVSIPVAQDITVNAANPDSNLNAVTTRGGLLSGLDDTGSDYRFFLQFNLPPIDTALINSAALVGYYTDDFGPVDSFHQLFFVGDDAWSETDVTWNTRPALGAATANGFDAGSVDGPGGTVRFDVSTEVIGEVDGDGVVSFGLTTIDGRFEDLEFFASREFDPSRAFRLDVNVTIIPLPSSTPIAAALIAACLGLTTVAKRRRH